MLYSILLLAISLSIDAFSVGLIYGLRQIKITLPSKILIAVFSVIYTSAALFAGKSLSKVVPFSVSKKIGVSILITMGVWIIIQALLKNSRNSSIHTTENTSSKTLLTIGLKSLGITIHIFKNPIEFDLDSSGTIDTFESILLGLGLSLDAIGVGIGSALLGFHSSFIPITVGFFQWMFLSSGAYFGEKITSNFNFNQKWLELIPGILLVFFALLRI
jgi:putative sporulation protein YtaF